MADTLDITWTDYRGKVWDLTKGTQGVILAKGQKGLSWGDITHAWRRGDQQHASARVGRITHTMAVDVGWGRQGQDHYGVRSEWWSEANSPYHTGRLRVTRPDGVTRYRDLRLAESPDLAYTWDPGLGLENGVEPWPLTGNDGWWLGDEQVRRYDLTTMGGSTGTPFYGPDGAGWPLYIGQAATARDAWVANRGQGPTWVTWTLVGPMSNVTVGVQGGTNIAYTGDIIPGEVVEVSTDPTNRYAVETGSGDSRYQWVSGSPSPVPTGDRVGLVISAEGMTEASSITATVTELYALPF